MKAHKAIIILLSIAFLGILTMKVFRPRGYKKMERIAIAEFSEVIEREQLGTSLNKFVQGKTVNQKDSKSIVFTWSCITLTGDTASIYIEVKRRVPPFQNRDNIVRKNEKWGYLKEPTRKSIEQFPFDSIASSQIFIQFDSSSNPYKVEEVRDVSKLILNKEKLLLYLRKGYFNVLFKHDNYVIIAFYEPIALLRSGTEKVKTMTAKIFINSNKELIILPYDAPPELWKNFNPNE